MRDWRLHAGAVLGALAFASPAFAQAQAPGAPTPQTAPRTTPPAAPAPRDGVTVTGTRPGVTTSIDSRSYLIERDLNAANGSVGDALRNVPSVEVDLQGNLSLRGDANVTILVDGKPSPLFSGQNRADALLNFPAKDLERVEVMTTPSAAFSPDGTGGIINLITKQARAGAPAAPPSTTGSVNAQYGSAGATRFGANLNHHVNKLNINLSGYRTDDFRKASAFQVRAARANPAATPFETATLSGQTFESGQDIINLNLRYDVSPKLAITGGLYAGTLTLDGPFFIHNAGTSAGRLVSDLISVGPARVDVAYSGGSTGITRKFTGEGHEFSANFTSGRTTQRQVLDSVNIQSTPPAPTVVDQTLFRYVLHQGQLKLNYKRPLPDSAKLNIGYDLSIEDDEFENQLARGPSLASRVVDLGVTNTYGLDQTIHAFYGTYERPFGRFTPQLGLRIEALDREIDQVTLGTSIERDTVTAYPTLNFGYKIDDVKSFRGGYSRRIQRPAAAQLNPFRSQPTRLNVSSGNPNLEPQETDSFELGYQQRSGQTFYLATGYWREARNEITAVITDEGNGVSLQTPVNLGSSRSGGIELVANGRFAGTLRYSLSSDMFWREIDADKLGFANARSAFGISGTANLTWDATAKDVLQLSATATGKRLAPQGYTAPYAVLNLGWRHKLNDRLSATLTLRDILDTSRYKMVVDTPTLSMSSVTKQNTRAAFFQLSYSFGGGRQPEPAFDFSAPPAAGN